MHAMEELKTNTQSVKHKYEVDFSKLCYNLEI